MLLFNILPVAVYSNAMQDNVNTLLYNGFIEELVDILEVKNDHLMVRTMIFTLGTDLSAVWLVYFCAVSSGFNLFAMQYHCA